jgi:hypothetical protein
MAECCHLAGLGSGHPPDRSSGSESTRNLGDLVHHREQAGDRHPNYILAVYMASGT